MEGQSAPDVALYRTIHRTHSGQTPDVTGAPGHPEVSVLHTKADIATEIVEAGYGPCSYEGSVSLAAKERRDIENGLLDRIAHNGEAAVRIKVPRSMARIFRNRLCRQPFGVADRGAERRTP